MATSKNSKLHQVAGSELAVDRQVEQRQIADPMLQLQADADAQMPRTFWPTGLPLFQGCRCWGSVEISSWDFDCALARYDGANASTASALP